jgi:hypothetical protein
MSCFVLFKDEAGCGEFMDQNNLERLSNCNQDVSAHLRWYHLSKESLPECDLILLRVEVLNVHGDFTTGKYACVLETLRQSWSLLELEE